LMVIEAPQMEAPKTKEYNAMLAALGIENKKSVLVLDDMNKNIYLSSRNLKGSKVVNASELNTYIIMNANNVVFTEGSIEKIEQLLS
jgi:large subunit ribosomal protein L4